MTKSKSILLAGFGGQGILFAAKQLASAAMDLDKYVTWLPSYGPETRGGTSNCGVVISDEEIGSPIVKNPDILVVFNIQAFEKFEPALKPWGTLFSDSTMINKLSWRDDISAYYVPASGIASDNDLTDFANVIMLGKIIAVTKLFDHDAFLDHMLSGIPASRAAMIDKNRRAFELGYGYK